MAAVADIFQEDIFTRITNVHWNTGSGIFIVADSAGGVYRSEDGFTWTLADRPFGDANHGQISDGAFGGGVFFLAGNTVTYSPEPGSDRINSRKDALAVASSSGYNWSPVASDQAPGVNDFNVYYSSQYAGTGFRFKLSQGRFLGHDGPTLNKFSNAGSDGRDDPTMWNSGGPFINQPETPVGPPNLRVTLQFGVGFKVVTKDAKGNELTSFSTIPGAPAYLCYGGRGTKRVFVSNGFSDGQPDDSSFKIWASTDAISWAPVFTVTEGNVACLLGGLPQTLRRGKKA